MKFTERTSPLAVVIEDEPNLSQIYSSAVQAAGFYASAFLDGEQGLNALKTLVPAIVVLDLHLPGVGGNKILEYIRSDKRLENTKVILITADTGMANMLDPDTDLTLLKPVSFHQLRDMAIRLRDKS
jgi:two-component system alkaline phosphatase synthesis response regulator PhoP